MEAMKKQNHINLVAIFIFFFILIGTSGKAHASYLYHFQFDALNSPYEFAADDFSFISPSLIGPLNISDDYINYISIDPAVSLNGLEVDYIYAGGFINQADEQIIITFMYQSLLEFPLELGQLTELRISIEFDNYNYIPGTYNSDYFSRYVVTNVYDTNYGISRCSSTGTLTITENPIPLPSAVLFLASGIACVISLRKCCPRSQ